MSGIIKTTNIPIDTIMKLNKLYSNSIKHLSESIQEDIIREAPHTTIQSAIPPELSFLDGRFIDLGFENLSLFKDDKQALLHAFVGEGVRIPGTDWQLRYLKTGHTHIEPVGDREPLALPEQWRAAVLVMDDNGGWSWIGKRVRPDQVGEVDLSQYQEHRDGYSAI